MLVTMDDNVCWRCGLPFGSDELQRTNHHVLPKQFVPVKNVLIPLHRKCHDEVTSTDTASMTAFTFRLFNECGELTRKVEALSNLLNNQMIMGLKAKK